MPAFNPLELSLSTIYPALGLRLDSSPVPEPESTEYAAQRFSWGGQPFIYRQAKLTPKKAGLFVTLWKRPTPEAEIAPLDSSDTFSRVIISACQSPERWGQFIFDRPVLEKRGIVCSSQKPGKRGFRIYPPWSEPSSKAALNTQAWQSRYFVELSEGMQDLERLRKLLLG